MQKLTRDRRELWGVSQGCFNPLRVRLTLLSEPDPSPPIHPCGCLRLRPQSLLYTNGAKAAPKRSRRSSPLGPATGARLLLDDDLNLDVCIGRHWRNHAVLLDEWALALLLARQRRRRRCSRLSPLPKALLAIDTDLDRGRREHQHSPSGTPLPVAGSAHPKGNLCISSQGPELSVRNDDTR